MKIIHKVLIPIFILLFISCKKIRNKTNDVQIIDDGISMNDPGIPIHILIDSIENYGAVHSFERLEIASLDYRSGEFLSTFLIMADKYENSSACMNVYYQIMGMYNVRRIEDSENGIYLLNSINNDAKQMAIKYLKKASLLGNKEAKNHLKEYKKKGLIK